MAATKANSIVMTEGRPLPQIIRFSVPLALTGILQLLFNAAETGIGQISQVALDIKLLKDVFDWQLVSVVFSTVAIEVCKIIGIFFEGR